MLVNLMHSSMQFSDTPEQKRADATKIFSRAVSRNVAWITGSEGGEQPLLGILKAAADDHGYTFHQYKSNWVCVQKSLIINGTYDRGAQTVVDNDLVAGPGHDLNYTWTSFKNAELGRVTVIASHLATRGRQGTRNPSLTQNKAVNRRLAKAIGDFTKKQGAGNKLVFYGGDQNDDDKFQDTFFGQPLTSAQDELKKYEDTHWGTIDVIASYNADGRVKAKSIKALDDHEFKLNTDHYVVEAQYEIKSLIK